MPISLRKTGPTVSKKRIKLSVASLQVDGTIMRKATSMPLRHNY